jgi:hypothetical protein
MSNVDRMLKETFGALRDFDGVRDEYYPGSKRRRRESLPMRRSRLRAERAEARADESWDARPWVKHLPDGREVEMFPIGSLAKALHRNSVTIRRWIRLGLLPRATYQTPPLAGTRGDAGRRLWTRRQIEGIAKIAKEEGLLSDNPPRMQNTRFTQKVVASWRAWL